MDWTHGYFSETGYTFKFFSDFTPARLRWIAALQGIDAPKEGFRYLDLGCGQGFHLIQLAALHPGSEFVGIDFMPEHIAHGRALAKAADLANVEFIEGDFIELGQSPNALGMFDYVVAHGVTTWISPEVRDGLFNLVGSVLRPGGLMYNSYNTFPGWLDAAPFQNLVLQYQKRSNGTKAIDESRDLFSKLKAAGGPLFKVLPNFENTLKAMDTADPAYLVQEYNNQHWQPVYSNHMLALVNKHKLSFISSATLPEVFDENLSSDFGQLIYQHEDPILRQTVKDLVLCQSFRRDVYVKGKTQRWKKSKEKTIFDQRFVYTVKKLPNMREEFVFQTPSLTISGQRDLYEPLLESFFQSGLSIGELASQHPKLDRDTIIRMVSLLLHGGWLAPEGDDINHDAKNLNRVVAQAVLDGAPYRNVCAPKLSTSVECSQLEMMLFGLITQPTGTADLSGRLIQHMEALGIYFSLNGNPVEDPSMKTSEANRFAELFLKNQYQRCKSFGAVD